MAAPFDAVIEPDGSPIFTVAGRSFPKSITITRKQP